MADERKKRERTKAPDLTLSVRSLKGKQSVRATFRLPEQAIELLSAAASQLGLKQKSLFDQLVEDTSVLVQVAKQAQGYSSAPKERRQKTFVLSRSSLVSLDHVAKAHHLPRDLLVEISIKRLLPVISAEKAKHEKRKVLLRDMGNYLHAGQRLLAKTGNLLGEDDPFYKSMENLVTLCRRNLDELEEVVEIGKGLDKLK